MPMALPAAFAKSSGVGSMCGRAASLVADLVDVKANGAGNAGFVEFSGGIAILRRQVPGTVDDAQPRLAELCLQFVGD